MVPENNIAVQLHNWCIAQHYCICENYNCTLLFLICYCIGALRLQLVLNSLDENAKEDFQNGTNGAVVSINLIVLFRCFIIQIKILCVCLCVYACTCTNMLLLCVHAEVK